MQLSERDVELIKQNTSQFVSLKYLDIDGVLKQIDASFSSVKEGSFFICDDNLNLKAISNKNFIDPFRSFPTTSFFCENIISKVNPRILATKLLKALNRSIKSKLSIELSFWMENEDDIGLTYVADPIDKHANFRSDVVSILEKIGIRTTFNFHGKTSAESVIGILGDNIIDLADNLILTKYIIANIADSYNLKAQFTFNSNANISLGIIKKIDEQSDFFLSMQKNIEQLFLISSRFNNHSFKLLNLYNYKMTNSDVALKIDLYCEGCFIPYLAFVELLMCSINKKLPQKELAQFFNDKKS